jgi:M6 family metalloprotease-like protein
LIDFSDEQFRPSQNVEWIDNFLFSPTNPNITDYYKENSEGRFSFVKSRIIGPLRYSDPSQPSDIDDASRWCAFNTKNGDGSPICPGTESNENIARRRVLQMAYEAGVDFNVYDRNRDGKVALSRDNGPMELLVLWVEGSPGGGGAFRGFGNITNCYQPTRVAGMPRQPELCGGVAGVGDEASFDVIIHEISHALKTIDLYHNCASINSLMSCSGGAPRHLDPWHKMLLGWIEPEIFETGVDFRVGQTKIVTLNSDQNRPSNHASALILADPAYRGQDEFFMLEYRSNNSRSGREYDSGVTTDGGIVVWQVNNRNPSALDIQPRNFGYSAGGWRVDKHIRMIGDFNGDQIGDIIGFGEENVFIMQGQKNEKLKPRGVQFGPLMNVIENYAINSGGWKKDKHVRVIGDVNGDGKDDIIGFGQKDVFVSVSTSTDHKPSFSSPQPWLVGNFAYERGGWRVDKHVRTVADVNGDGRADLVGFGQKDVFVSLAHPTQNKFLNPQPWLVGNFAYERSGWRVDKHVRTVADVNGDGRADLVGFGQKDVFVSLAHPTENKFLNPQRWLSNNFSVEGGNWRVDKHVRTVADVNGDGRADLVGFGQEHVFVSLAHPSQSRFLSPQIWLEGDLTYDVDKSEDRNRLDWRVDKHVRTVKDINGDGYADLVGFGEYGVEARLARPGESDFIPKANIMRKVFSIAPDGTTRYEGNKIGLYGGNQAFKRRDGRIELKWLNGRPAFTVELIGLPTESSKLIRVRPNQP